MQISESGQSIIIIAGMHRSGTSLVASLLQSAGINIGQRLMGKGEDNKKGHFEDLDFVEFHEKVLRSQGISAEGWTLEKNIQVQQQYVDPAKLLVQERNLTQKMWGWKDPRTTLFLRFWLEIIPEASFLLVYRSPWEVIDSLYRRGDDVFKNNPNFALKIWMAYNQAILDFYENFPERCLLLNLDAVVRNPKSLGELIDKRLGISLGPIANLYEESLLNRQISSSHRPTLLKEYFPEALDLYYELHLRAKLMDSFSDFSVYDKPVEFPSYREWVLQDWLDMHRANKELKRSQSQLQQTAVELERFQFQVQHTQAEYEQLQSYAQHTQAEYERLQAGYEQLQSYAQHTQAEYERLQGGYEQLQSYAQHTQAEYERLQAGYEHLQAQVLSTQIELEHSQAQVLSTQVELEHSQAQVQSIQIELERSQRQLQQTQAEMERTLGTIRSMESTKFWKLRIIWFKVKRKVRKLLGFSTAD